MSKVKAALFYNYPSAIEGEVFGQGRRERIAALTELYPHVVHAGNFDEHAAALADIEVIFAHLGHDEFHRRAAREIAEAEMRCSTRPAM